MGDEGVFIYAEVRIEEHQSIAPLFSFEVSRHTGIP